MSSDDQVFTNVVMRIERLPITRVLAYFFMILGFGYFLDDYDIASISSTMPVISRQLNLAPFDISTTIAGAFMGALVGSLIAGWLGDKLGRRRLFLYTLFIIGAGGLMSAVSQNTWQLVVSRIISGFGYGADVPIIFAYLSELVPSRARVFWFGILMVVADIAFPVVSLMAYAFTTVDPLLGWRYVFVLMAIIAGAVALARTSIPESPRYYLARGQKDLAEKALREIEGRTQRYCKKPLPEPDLSKKVSSLVQETRYRELFSRSYMRRTIAIGGMWAFYVFGFYGITAFLPLILVAKGFTIVRALLFSAVGYTGFIVGAALPSVIGERVQRGTAFNVFSLLAGACGIALALSTSDVQVIVLSFLTSMFALCTYIPMISYTPELFPTRMRASASGWGYGMGRLASIIAIYIIGVGLAGNTFAQIAFPAVSFVIAISFMVVAGIKTSGVTLEDISR